MAALRLGSAMLLRYSSRLCLANETFWSRSMHSDYGLVCAFSGTGLLKMCRCILLQTKIAIWVAIEQKRSLGQPMIDYSTTYLFLENLICQLNQTLQTNHLFQF